MPNFADDLSEGLHIGIAEVAGEVLLDVPAVDGLGEEWPPLFRQHSIVATAVLSCHGFREDLGSLIQAHLDWFPRFQPSPRYPKWP